jgi:hypothetical protein
MRALANRHDVGVSRKQIRGGGTASEPAPASAAHVIHDQHFVTSGRLTGQGVAASLDRCIR